MILRACAALLVAAGVAAAQQQSIEEQIRKQAEEVSRLMRESERLLLEISRVDRLVENQKQVEEELKKLLPPEQGAQGAAEDERARQRQELESKQAALKKELDGMLSGQKENATLTVQQLQELLKSMPRRPSNGGEGDPNKSPQDEQQQKRMQDKQEEKKQHQPQMPRKPEDDSNPQHQRSDRKKPSENPEDARTRRIAAWIAHLPAEEKERINRNDLSRVPVIYRSFIAEYTARRAKREAEKETDAGR